MPIRIHQDMNEKNDDWRRQARQSIREAIERYSTQRYHQGIGDIKPTDRHQGRENQIKARREELFSSIKRNGRKPKIFLPV